MEPRRLLLANGHPIIRSSLRSLLEREPAFRVVGEAADAHEAMLLTEYLHPDVVLLDLSLKPAGGLAAARELARLKGALKLVLLADQTDEEYVFEACKTGVQGYVAADVAPADLVRAIQVVSSGKRFLSPSVSAHFLDKHASSPLGDKQKQLYCLLAAGYSEDELAALLHQDASQVRAARQELEDALRKLEVQDFVMQSGTYSVVNG